MHTVEVLALEVRQYRASAARSEASTADRTTPSFAGAPVQAKSSWQTRRTFALTDQLSSGAEAKSSSAEVAVTARCNQRWSCSASVLDRTCRFRCSERGKPRAASTVRML